MNDNERLEDGPVSYFDETTSTMDEARSLALAGAREGTVVVAGRQSAGRGRIGGRTWTAPPEEALLATVILGAEKAVLPGLTLRIGLALARACEAAAAGAGSELRVAVKWPNDLLVDGRKLGGILCEAGPWGLLAGFGLNVAQRGFEGALEQRATSLAIETRPGAFPPEPWPGNRARLLGVALREIGRALGEEGWRAAMEERLWGRGRVEDISLGSPGAGPALRARILGIGGNGALIVEDEGGGRREVLSGEYGTALTAERRII